MGAQTYDIFDVMEGINYKALMVKVDSCTAADTVTVAQFDTVTLAYGINLASHAAITCTPSANVITVGAGPAAQPILIFCYGYKS